MRISKKLMVQVGEVIPKGYGLVYWDFCRDEAIFLPIPLNILARMGRIIYWRFVYGLFPDKFEQKLQDAYYKGKSEGW